MSRRVSVEYQYSPYLKVMLDASIFTRNEFCAHVVDRNKAIVVNINRNYNPTQARGGTDRRPLAINKARHVIMGDLSAIYYNAAIGGLPQWVLLEQDVDIGAIRRELPTLREKVEKLRKENTHYRELMGTYLRLCEKYNSGRSSRQTQKQRPSNYPRIVLPEIQTKIHGRRTLGTGQTTTSASLHDITQNMVRKQNAANWYTQQAFEVFNFNLKVEVNVATFHDNDFTSPDAAKLAMMHAIHNVIDKSDLSPEKQKYLRLTVNDINHVIVHGVLGIYYKTSENDFHPWKRLEMHVNIVDLRRDHTALQQEIKVLTSENAALKKHSENMPSTYEAILTGNYTPHAHPTRSPKPEPAPLRVRTTLQTKPAQTINIPRKTRHPAADRPRKKTRQKKSFIKDTVDKVKDKVDVFKDVFEKTGQYFKKEKK